MNHVTAFRRYRLQLTFQKALWSLVFSGFFLLGIGWMLNIHWFDTQWILASALLPLICGTWAFLSTTPNDCLQRLQQKHPQLAEDLKIAFDLEQQSLNENSQQWQQSHVEKLQQQLDASPQQLKVSLHKPTLLLCIMMAFMAWQSKDPAAFLKTTKTETQNRPIAGLSFRVLAPGYSGKPPQIYEMLPQPASLLKGSRLEAYWAPNPNQSDPKQSASYQTSEHLYELTWQQQHERWLLSIAPQQSGTLTINFPQAAQEYPVEITPDQPPVLNVVWPEDDHVFSNSELPIQLDTSDDYGLKKIVLHYESKGESYQEIIQSFEGNFQTHQEQYLWELAYTPLMKDDEVTAWIEVIDNNTLSGPGVTQSEKWTFRIKSMKAYHLSVMEKVFAIEKQLGRLLEGLDARQEKRILATEKSLLAQLDELQEDLQHDDLLSPQLKRLLMQELRNQIYRFQRIRR